VSATDDAYRTDRWPKSKGVPIEHVRKFVDDFREFVSLDPSGVCEQLFKLGSQNIHVLETRVFKIQFARHNWPSRRYRKKRRIGVVD
jgi:hypothetical protein